MLFGDASLSIVELIATIGIQELTLSFRSFKSSAELFYHSFPHNDFYHNKVPQNWLKMHHGVFRKGVGL